MAALFILMAILALYGVLDALAGISRAWSRSRHRAPVLPLFPKDHANVKVVEKRTVIR